MKVTLALVLVILLTGCTTPLKPSKPIIEDNPIVALNCPDLIPFPKDQEVTLGDMLLKIIQIANQYELCRTSANPSTAIEGKDATRIRKN